MEHRCSCFLRTRSAEARAGLWHQHFRVVVQTAPSTRPRFPVKHMSESVIQDDGSPLLLSSKVADTVGSMDSAAAMVLELMCKGVAARPPVICSSHVQDLGRCQAAGYGAYCTNQAAEGNNKRLKEQCKAEAGAPHAVIQHSGTRPPASCFQQGSIYLPLSLPPTAHEPACSSVLDPPTAGIIHQRPHTIRYTISVFTSFATQSACGLLRKSQVQPACYRYRPLNVLLATSQWHSHGSKVLHESQACCETDPPSHPTSPARHFITSGTEDSDTSCF
jgi:hypothetical protein